MVKAAQPCLGKQVHLPGLWSGPRRAETPAPGVTEQDVRAGAKSPERWDALLKNNCIFYALRLYFITAP